MVSHDTGRLPLVNCRWEERRKSVVRKKKDCQRNEKSGWNSELGTNRKSKVPSLFKFKLFKICPETAPSKNFVSIFPFLDWNLIRYCKNYKQQAYYHNLPHPSPPSTSVLLLPDTSTIVQIPNRIHVRLVNCREHPLVSGHLIPMKFMTSFYRPRLL